MIFIYYAFPEVKRTIHYIIMTKKEMETMLSSEAFSGDATHISMLF